MAISRNSVWTIIGAGFGGKGFIAHLGTDGFKLRIHDIDESIIAPIRAAGGVYVKGAKTCLSPVEMATTDLSRAVDGAAVIVVCTYGTEHEAVARQLAPLLREGQIVLLVQGHFCGALLFRRALETAGCKARVDVTEMDAYPYMVGILAPDTVFMATVKQRWQLASSPASRIGAVMDAVGFAFPGMVGAPNLLHTAFVDFGGIFHVAGIITNVSRVENDEEYHFYAANMVPSVCNLIEAMDRERVAVARAYAVRLADVRTWLAQTYSIRHESLHASMQEMAATHFKHAPAPKSLTHRYLAQDASCAVVGTVSLGSAAKVATPVSTAAVEISGALMRRNFFEEGRNLRRLGLERKTVAEIVASIST